MKYMLDTNICIYLIKKRPPQTLRKLQQISISDVCVSAVSVAELEYGVEKSRKREQNRIALAEFLAPVEILSFGDEQASAYGSIRAHLESRGTPIGPYDLQIAAHALSLGLRLVTNNTSEFERVPGLSIENWA
ncbi:MAG: PIN domain-containing protein [Chitinivibrionales bacterium]|nr:PIN domain-containing protein [Chitinivibrionales bacterium]